MDPKKSIFVIILLLSLILFTSCSTIKNLQNVSMNDTFKNYHDTSGDLVNQTMAQSNSTNGTIGFDNQSQVPMYDIDARIGSFNVQVFGQTKADNKYVMDALGDIIDDYDILAFQEIRDKSGEAFKELMNKKLPNDKYIISERLGRSKNKEQYAFIYSNRVTVNRPIVYPDKNDYFERPPFMAEFNIESHPYVIMVIHTKPTDAQEEIKHLQDVVVYAENYYSTDDIIIMGDLNADCSYYTPGMYLNQYNWLIDDDVDTTVGKSDCAYDRIITVLNYGERFYDCEADYYDDDSIGDEELLPIISDHFPVKCMVNI